jgi:hypothetical protein
MVNVVNKGRENVLHAQKGLIDKQNAHIARLLREIAALKDALLCVTQQRDVLEERITVLLRNKK